MRTVYTVEDLINSWGLSRSAIRTMETDGKLHRLINMPGVRYSAQEVVQLESLDEDTKGLTAWERHKLTQENNEMREELNKLRHDIAEIACIAQSTRR